MQAWPLAAIIAATILVATQAGDDPFAPRAAAGIGSVLAGESAGSGGGRVEPRPLDDGSIIVECVVHGGHGAPDEDERRGRSKAHGSDGRLATAPPRIPLDPSPCWWFDVRRRR